MDHLSDAYGLLCAQIATVDSVSQTIAFAEMYVERIKQDMMREKCMQLVQNNLKRVFLPRAGCQSLRKGRRAK